MHAQRWGAFAAGSLLLAAGLAAAQGADKDSVAKGRKLMAGTWRMVAGTMEGEEAPAEVRRSFRMVIDADGKVKDGEGEKASTGSLKIDPDKKPKTLDLIYTAGRLKGHTYLAIYEIDGDTLRICSAHTGGGRPTEFTAKAGSNCALVILKREKPGAGAGKK